MSKLSILKELTDLRSLVTRRSLTGRAGILGLLLLTGLYWGREGMTYVSTATRLASNRVQESIPVTFELERARTMINNLIPDVRRNMLVIAQEEVAVEGLQNEVAQAETALASSKDEIMAMRGDMTNQLASYRIGDRPATPEEMQEELARKFTRYQTSETTIDAKRQLLAARQKSLDAARVKLTNVLNSKRDLEIQLENLEARLKSQQSQAVASSVEFDDTQVARCKELVDTVRIRLEVADRLLAHNGEIDELVTPVSTGDIAEQVDQYFRRSGEDNALAKAPN